jgi:hypothetical protein
LQKSKKEITLLSSHGYKGQEQITKFKYEEDDIMAKDNVGKFYEKLTMDISIA